MSQRSDLKEYRIRIGLGNLPVTKKEWQEAVDTASFYLLIDSAAQYGLLEANEKVNIDNCINIIDKARRIGIFPTEII